VKPASTSPLTNPSAGSDTRAKARVVQSLRKLDYRNNEDDVQNGPGEDGHGSPTVFNLPNICDGFTDITHRAEAAKPAIILVITRVAAFFARVKMKYKKGLMQ